jgi:tetratricopeptide (TPR) repeat protein
VTVDGRAKVLDFGIAQVLHGDTARPSSTETALRPMSMACASPEQLRGERLSLASDVYSLGVLLYEVSTGVNPQFRPDATFDQNLQSALVDDPPPPSRVVRSLPRDLDAIVAKAMAKMPEARYPSVAELQADLERMLAGRPVLAVPPRPGYVLRRFVARNKGLTAIAAALAIAVAGGSAYYFRQARIEQRRFEDARRLVHAVVFDIQPQLEKVPGTLALRRTLIAETLTYLEAVSRDVGNNVPLLRELSNSYAQLGVIHGDAVASNLGDRVAAAREFARAAEFMDRALALAGDDPDLLAEASALDRRRSDFAIQGEQRDDAVRLAVSAVAHADRSLALAPERPAGLEARAMAWFAQGRALMGKDPDAALALFGRAAAHFASTSPPDALPREAGLIEFYISDIFIKRSDAERGPAHAREALRLTQAALGRAPSDQRARHDVALAAGQLASGLFNAGSAAAAEGYFAMAVDMREQIAAADPENVRAIERLALSKGRFGTILARAGKFAPAQAAIERSVALYEGLQATGRLAPTMEADFAETLNHLGDYHRRRANAPAACAAFGRAVRLLQAAAARQPLPSSRQRQLDYVLGELETCASEGR